MNRNRGGQQGRVTVGPVTVEGTGLAHRVTAEVDGAPLWFESADIALVPAPEAYGSAILIPALHHRARLQLADPVDPVWRDNIRQMVPILRRWWRFPCWTPESPAAADDGVTARSGPAPAALFFSGGVDSFHRLLRGDTRVDWIITLWGFDFPLDDHKRAQAVDASVRRIAAATGTRAAVVRTNAREHPLFRDTPWERAYGGLLAAVGHLIEPAATRAIISFSAPGDRDIPYGSHWRIDPLWSSSRTAILHEGRGGRRIDKLRAIASEPLVREHLRVCWRNLAPVGNCSRCAKCLLAMLILEECGELEHSRVFEGRHDLASRIEALPKTPDRYHSFAELARSPNLDPGLAASVRALVRRSRYAVRPDVKLRRAAVGWLLTRLGMLPRRGVQP